MSSRIFTGISASLVVVSAIVTAYLWHQLRTEREVTAGLRNELSESEARARESRMAPAQVDSAAPASPSVSQMARDGTQDTATQGSRTVFISGNSGMDRRGLLDDPEYRTARFATFRSSIAQAHPGLAEAIGMNSGEADRLFDLLAENQMAMLANIAIDITGDEQVDRAAMEEISRTQQALQRQQTDAIREFLGDERYDQWQAYQPTRSTRIQANVHAGALAQAGSPLDSAQLNALVTALLEEQRSLQRDTVALGRTVDPSNPQSQMQAQAALRSRHAQVNQRILDATSTSLSPQQLDLLRVQLNLQEAINSETQRVRERINVAPNQP